MTGELPRLRVCPQGHEFRTLERRDGIELDYVMVRSQALPRRARTAEDSGSPHYNPFDQQALTKNVSRTLLGSLENEEVEAVVVRATADLLASTDKIAKPINDERVARGRYTHYILNTHVRDHVLDVLQSIGRPSGGGGSARYRVAYVLYALSTLGNVYNEKQGWTDAEEVVGWLQRKFPDLEREAGYPTAGIASEGRPQDTWWPPLDRPPTLPRHIVKRHAKVRRRRVLTAHELTPTLGSAASVDSTMDSAPGRGRTETAPRPHVGDRTTPLTAGQPALYREFIEDFVPNKLRDSIENALIGRPNSKRNANLIWHYVLWQLIGQEVVLSSQLGTLVADCLRRVDDIAYLRWVTIGKELRVSWIYREALGLVSYPSPQLRFSREAAMRNVDRRHPSEAFEPEERVTPEDT